MRKLCLIIGAAVALSAAVSTAASAQDRNYRFAFTSFGIELPAGVIASVQQYGSDDIYSFERAGKTFMQMYVGNHPLDTVFVEHKQYVTAGYIGGRPEISIVYTYPNDVTSRETIVTLGGNQTWPLFVHAWYADLPAEQSALADEIISTIGSAPLVSQTP